MGLNERTIRTDAILGMKLRQWLLCTIIVGDKRLMTIWGRIIHAEIVALLTTIFFLFELYTFRQAKRVRQICGKKNLEINTLQ